MKYFLFTFLILFFPFIVFSQQSSVEIHGVIKNTKGEFLPRINVVIPGTTLGTSTDNSGKYDLKNIPEREFVLKIQGIGYKTIEKQITPGKNNIELNFEIEEDPVKLNEVVISSNRHETIRKESPIIVNVLNSRDIENTNPISLGQIMSLVPGVRVESDCLNCGFREVRMNGLEGPYSQILIDSKPLFSAFSSVNGLEQVPINMIERVEVLRGGGSVLFGPNAVAGTINIITKEPGTNSYNISYGYSSINSRSSDNSTNINTTFITEDRKTGLNFFAAMDKQSPYDHNFDGYTEIAESKNTILGLNSYYRISDYNKISLTYRNQQEKRRGGNKMDYEPYEADNTDETDKEINTASLSFDNYSIDNKSQTGFYISFQDIFQNSFYKAEEFTDAYGETKDRTLTAGLQYSVKFEDLLFSPAMITSGLEYEMNKYSDKIPRYNLNLEQNIYSAGFFIQSEWKTGKYDFLLGGRIDKHNLIDNVIITPRAGFRYNISDNLFLRLNYSSGFRAPQAYDEEMHTTLAGGKVLIMKMDDDLKEERSNSYSLSFDYYLKPLNIPTGILVESFYTAVDNVFIMEEEGEQEDGSIIIERSNGLGAKVYGINLEARIAPSESAKLSLGFTIQKSEYDEPEAWSDDPGLEPATKIPRSPEKYGYLNFTCNFLYNLYLSVTGIYTGSMQIPHLSGYINKDRMETSPDYFECNLKISRNFTLSNEIILQINAGIRNLFNSYQNDFDKGMFRDNNYIYGPSAPRTLFLGVKAGNIL
jgi:outer membrane receptor for ferrienterochelin and colicins